VENVWLPGNRPGAGAAPSNSKDGVTDCGQLVIGKHYLYTDTSKAPPWSNAWADQVVITPWSTIFRHLAATPLRHRKVPSTLASKKNSTK